MFDKFRALPGAVEKHGEGKQRYLFVPGTRPDRCVLVAHADTVFDVGYDGVEYAEQGIVFKEGFVSSIKECPRIFWRNLVFAFKNKKWKSFRGGLRDTFKVGCYHGTNPSVGIGADDRAGCAMLWLLRDSGHSLLILDGEEHGQIGSRYLRYHSSNSELFSLINGHTFMLQLDRRGSRDYKCYALPVSQEFRKFIEDGTGYTLSTGTGKTDIQVLCRDICGVNLSIGYYDEHRPTERLCLAEWEHTLEVVKKLIASPLKRYPLEPQKE